ncbi:hypothetical protein KIP80_11415, partial [Citrobacter braakii]|nr:hypothetical protein [Citrobacter braakii]
IFINSVLQCQLALRPCLAGLDADCDLADCPAVFINVVKCVGYSKDGRYFSSLITVSGGCE